MKKKIIAAVFILFLIIACIVIYFGQRPENQTGLFYSGTIESTNSELAFQVSGKVSAVHVREGQAVEKGQVLAELDSDEYKARLEIANAEFERATQQVEQLQSNLSVLRKTLPADVAKAEAGLKAASATLEDAARDRDRYGQLFRKGVISAKENERMTLRYDTAFAGNAEAEATLRQAKSNLSKIHSLEKEIEAGRAQIRAAKAAVDQASLQLKYSTLTAPYRGIITVRSIEPGEVITPTRQVLTLSDLSTVDLKIYVSETELGKVKPAQNVEVRTDTFPGKIYTGKVTFISPEGEFTPKIIQTHKERVKLVYLVKVTMPNPNLELKSGMPADAWLY